MKQNKIARDDLCFLYGAKCMLTDYKERLTYHHNIKKKCEKGKETIANGALLNTKVHSYIHSIENTNEELYDEICSALQLYKKCRDENKTECLIEWEAVKEQIRRKIK